MDSMCSEGHRAGPGSWEPLSGPAGGQATLHKQLSDFSIGWHTHSTLRGCEQVGASCPHSGIAPLRENRLLNLILFPFYSYQKYGFIIIDGTASCKQSVADGNAMSMWGFQTSEAPLTLFYHLREIKRPRESEPESCGLWKGVILGLCCWSWDSGEKLRRRRATFNMCRVPLSNEPP